MTSDDSEETVQKKFNLMQIKGKDIFVFSFVLWTLLLLVMLYLYLDQDQKNMEESARLQARSAFDKDVLYRSWNASFGGVYATQSKEVPPNEYLSNVEERGIETASGKKLTLMNPAYMTRLVHELGRKELGIIAHITSLDPIRPENDADEWETNALTEFENGKDEVSSIEIIDGEPYMNFMKPLITDKTCLKCHAEQGYKFGDIRGGIRVSVPLNNFYAALKPHKRNTILYTIILWIIGLMGLIYWKLKVQKSEVKRLKVIKELKISNMTKDRFFSLIAHDLKSPFNTILGLSEILSENIDDFSKAEIKKMTTSLNSVSKDSFELLENLLDWSRSQMKKLEVSKDEIKLDEIIKDSIKVLNQVSLKKNLTIKIDVPENYCVFADPSMLRTIFRNLVSNAMKFSNIGSEIIISASQMDDEVVVSVKDFGVGIPQNKLKTIFQLISRTSDDGTDGEKGTGLGLLISKEFTEMNGGIIWVESKIGKGTTFFFSLKGSIKV